MFSDPLVAVMAMLILCFSGILVMFIFLIRSLAGQRDEMRDSFRKQQMYMADLERQFLEMNFAFRKVQSGDDPAPDLGGMKNSSQDMPLLREEDALVSMLESAARPQNAAPPYPDLRLSSEAAGGEYDPATDPHLFEDSYPTGAGAGYGARRTSRGERDKERADVGDVGDYLSLRRDG